MHSTKESPFNILLSGFMGSGKTYFLERLSEVKTNDVLFYDLDVEIVGSYDSALEIPVIISQLGWAKFRELEFKILKKLLKSSGVKIIGLGGGALNEKTMEFLGKNNNSAIVWLDTPFEVCFSRIKKDSNRPLAQKGREFLSDLYLKRTLIYKEALIRLTEKERDDINSASELIKMINIAWGRSFLD